MWTDERIAQLRALWADGLSAREVAEKMGDGMTRNSVLSKLRWLRVPPRTTGWEHRKETPVLLIPRQPRQRPQIKQSFAPERAEPYVECAPIVAPESKPVTLMRLKNNSCRWPLGQPKDADFRFCGADKASGSYCAFHAQLAYRPSAPKPEAKTPARMSRTEMLAAADEACVC